MAADPGASNEPGTEEPSPQIEGGRVDGSTLWEIRRLTRMTRGQVAKAAGMIVVGVLAFVLTVFAGMFWRKIGCRVWFGLLSVLGVSRADDTPSAWMALHERADSYLTQIAVELDDGAWLYCDDTTKFAKAPQGPCVLGSNGDVGMYLTHQKRQGGERTAVLTTRDAKWGDRLTWIPASRIRRVSLRQRSKD